MPAEHAPAFVDFAGEEFAVPADGRLTIGRDGDLAIDDNPYLHRRFLELAFHNGMLWLSNVGSSTAATLSDKDGLLHSWLSPGARLPIVFPRTMIWFTAGPTTYELEVVLSQAPFLPSPEIDAGNGETTTGRVTLTPEQRLLVIALAEDILRKGDRRSAVIPPSAAVAERLGWTTTKLNRKLDNVCEKLSRLGVRGLVTQGDRAASSRRARLVEYALASRLVTVADLAWLDAVDSRRSTESGKVGVSDL